MFFKKKKPEQKQVSLFNQYMNDIELFEIHKDIMQETKEFLTNANIEKMTDDLHRVKAMYKSFAKGILEENPRNTFDHIKWTERAEGIQYAISYLNYLIKNQEK